MVKKTVAIIGETAPGSALLETMIQQDLRLLIISREPEYIELVKQELEQLSEPAEVEFLTCEKEGCWEADLIAFTRPAAIEPSQLNRIKQVSTQKVVLIISEDKAAEKEKQLCFQELLPHSKVVELEIKERKFRIFGRNEKANALVSRFFTIAGYKEIQ